MNKNLLKKILITVGLALLIFVFIYYSLTGGVGYAWRNLLVIFVEYDDVESQLTIWGIILLVCGIIIPKQDNKIVIDTEDKCNRLKTRYKRLKILGYLPFIGILVLGIGSSLFGFEFFGTCYGIEAFVTCVFMVSFLIWPFYIVGLVLIIKSSQKLKEIKNK